MHLRPAEFIDAIDTTLPARRRRHLDGCERCQDQLAQVALSMKHVQAADAVPEPSPLLWTHMRERVRAATADAAPDRASWFIQWRPAMAMGVLAAVAVVAVVVRHGAVTPSDTVELITSPAADIMPVSDADADERLDFVAQLASTLSYDELQVAMTPTRDAADAMVEQLTDAERAELVRLLKAESGSSE